MAPGPCECCSTIPTPAGQHGCTSAQTGGSTAPVALLLKLEEKKDPLGRIKGLSVPSAASFPKTLTTSYQAEQLTEKQTRGLGGDHSRVMKTLAQLIFNSSNMSTQCQGGSSCIAPPRLFFSRKTRCKIIHVDKTPYLQSRGIFCGTACTQCPRLTRHRALPRCMRVTTIACDVDTDISTPLGPLGRQHLCAHSLLPRISCRTGNTSQEGFKTC